MSKLSVLGLYRYDQTLFDDLHLPADFTADDRATLINNLLMECAEFECVYPDFEFCKAAIGWWSSARLHVWEKLYASLFFDYNPIWNKDGTITETRTREYSDEKSGSVNNNKYGTTSQTDITAETNSSSGTQSSTTEEKTAGFNSNDYVKKGQTIGSLSISDGGSTTGELRRSGNYADTDNSTETGTTSGDETVEYTRVEQGNIGVTSTQQLIKEEREVVQFEIDDYIIHDFKKQFCITIY